MIKKAILTFTLILAAYIFPADSAYCSDIDFLKQEQKTLSFLRNSDLSSLVFYSEYDVTIDDEMYFNPTTRELIKKLLEIKKLCEQSNMSVAYSEYKKIINTMPSNDFYYMMLAYDLTQTGFFSLAHVAMSKIEDKEIWAVHTDAIRKYTIPKVNLKIQEEVFLAELLSDIVYNNMTNESLTRLSKSESSLANSDYGCYVKAKAYFAEKNNKEALTEINKALSQNEKNINYIKFKAEILRAENNNQEALKVLKSIPEQDILYAANHKETEKIKYYTLTNTKDNSINQKYNLAYYFYLNKDYPRAANELNLMVIRGSEKDAGKLLGTIYFLTGKYDDAEKLYRKILLKNSKVAYAHKGLGDIYLLRKQNALAYNEYKSAYKYNPKDIETLVGLIVSCVKIGDNKSAEKYLEKAEKTAPNNYKVLYLCSQIKMDRGKLYLKNSLKYNPFYPEGWLDMAKDALDMNDINSVEEYVNTVAFITKNNARYFYYKSLLNTEKKDFEAAEKDIQFAKKLFIEQNGAVTNEQI